LQISEDLPKTLDAALYNLDHAAGACKRGAAVADLLLRKIAASMQ
jgi:hypothetical protein